MKIFLELRSSVAQEEELNVTTITIPKYLIDVHSLRYLVDANDSLLCTLSFKRKLNDKKEKLIQFFKDKFKDGHNKVFSLNILGNNHKFDFSFILARFLKENMPTHGIFVGRFKDTSFYEFWDNAYKTDIYLDGVGGHLKENEVVALLNSMKFNVAKTMPSNPHSYTLRKNWSNKHEFYELARYLRNTLRIRMLI